MAIPNRSISNMADLAWLDSLQAPLWVFDIEKMKMLWANRAALKLWSASTPKKLSHRTPRDNFEAEHICFLLDWPQLEAEALRSLEAFRYCSAIASLYDLDGKTILQNLQALRCYGKTQTLNQCLVDPTVAQTAIAQMKSGQPLSLKTQVKTKTQEIRWHNLNFCPLPDPIGGTRMILVREQEITDTVKLEAVELEIRRSQSLLDAIARISGDLLQASHPGVIEEALATLGNIAGVQRLEIAEESTTRSPLGQLRWQWVAEESIDCREKNRERKSPNPYSFVFPIEIEGIWQGVLRVEARRDRPWTKSDRSVFEIAAGTIGNAIARFAAEGQLAEVHRQLHQCRATQPSPGQICPSQRTCDVYIDALTGLPNRAFFMEELQRALKRGKQAPSAHFAILFLDLDRFKVINDSLGYLIGDSLLAKLAQHLRTILNDCDLVARLGGDEFAILLHQTDQLSHATQIADRIHRSLSTPFHIEGQEIFTSASIGIAMSSAGYEHPEELLRDADIVMYHAKDRGRSRSEVFDGAMHDRLLIKLKLEHDLRQALQGLDEDPATGNSARNPFQLYYQPIVKLTTGKIVGFEALVRWQHPLLGSIPPEEFIPIAEESGAIVPLGQWVLAEACRQLQIWRSQFPQHADLTMSVNFSCRQFFHSNAIAQIDRILQQTGVDGKALKLEVTESVLMDRADLATDLLWQLKAREIQLCLDDFGTGYSSLSYLHRFPLDTLKIDRSFVKQMDVEDKNYAIVQTIVTLAHNLGMKVIPEGVETPEQRDKLANLGCQFGQGYLFSQPLDRSIASRWLAENDRI